MLEGPLLEDPAAMEAMRGMYRRFLDVAARHGVGALMGGLDYRASSRSSPLPTLGS